MGKSIPGVDVDHFGDLLPRSSRMLQNEGMNFELYCRSTKQISSFKVVER